MTKEEFSCDLERSPIYIRNLRPRRTDGQGERPRSCSSALPMISANCAARSTTSCQPTTAARCSSGLMATFCKQIDRDDEEVLKRHGLFVALAERRKSAIKIDCKWCATKEYSWTFETESPHAAFDVLEDDDKFLPRHRD